MTRDIKLGIQQRVLPVYRLGFFDMLAGRLAGNLEIFAGHQRAGEGITENWELQTARLYEARNRYFQIGHSHLLWQANINEWLEEWNPDCLIAEINPRNRTTAGAIRWMHHRNRKVIGWGLGQQNSGLMGRIKTAAWRNFILQFDAVITYSTLGKERFASLGFDDKRIFVAPNAVAAKPTSAFTKRPARYRDGRPVVLFVGRLINRKRLDVLLQACAGLPGELQPDILVAGDGPARDDWERLAKQIFPHTTFLGDLRGAALEPHWRAADLFVLPGTGGLAVQQAMSFGLPVVVGEADGTQADLVRPENGWQLRTGSQEELGAVLKAALGDISRLRMMGDASYRIVSKEINLENMVDRFIDVISQVTGAK